MREAARRRALVAMAEAVGERGYVETTVRDVLERARMSRRTFYELFDNREECFLAAYDQARSDLMLQIAQEPGEEASDHLAAAIRRALAFLADRPDRARMLVVEAISVGPPGIERHERTMSELAERLARFQAGLAELVDDGLRLRCEASVGALHRVIHSRIVQGRTRELPELGGELASLMGELAPTG